MPKNKRKGEYLDNGSYDEMLARSGNTANEKDFFADDDLDESESPDSVAPNGAVRAKMNDIRVAVSARREAKGDSGVEIHTKVGRRRSAAPIGVIFTLLAFIGVGTLVYLAASGISAVINDESRLTKYDNIISPVVFFDPDTFETCQDPKMKQDLLTISVWETLDKNPNGFSVNEENGRTVMPTEQVAQTAKKLFGPDVSLDFNAFLGDSSSEEDASCIWNEEQGTIEVLMANFEGYSHKVLSVSKKKDTVICTVGYVSSYGENENTYSKVMLYILKKNPETKTYYISAIREAQ